MINGVNISPAGMNVDGKSILLFIDDSNDNEYYSLSEKDIYNMLGQPKSHDELPIQLESILIKERIIKVKDNKNKKTN